MESAEKKGLTGEEIDEKRAKQIAKEFIGEDRIQELNSNGLIENGNIQVYDFNAKINDNGNNNNLTISIAKKGGHIVNMNYNREVKAEVISQNEANEKGKEIVEMAHAKGITVEAEVGAIGGEEDGKLAAGECADPEECRKIAETGIDLLAAGIGNIHGKYPENWAGLSFETLEAVRKATGHLPLVLHGGTGIPEDMVKKSIDMGVCKININTECQLAFTAEVRKYIEEGKDLVGKGFDPRKLLKPGTEAIKQTVRDKMEMFGSIGKAE